MDSIEALVEYAEYLDDAEKYENALEILDEILRDYPSNFNAQNVRMATFHAMGEDEQIVRETTKRIEQIPNDTNALLFRAIVRYSTYNLMPIIQDIIIRRTLNWQRKILTSRRI